MTVETIASNPYFEALLAGRNYQQTDGHFIYREKILAGTSPEAVHIPAGFTIQHIKTAELIDRVVDNDA